MSTGGINSSKPVISDFNTSSKPAETGDKKLQSSPVSNLGLKGFLLKCKSGIKSAPEKFKVIFSLYLLNPQK